MYIGSYILSTEIDANIYKDKVLMAIESFMTIW